MIATGRFRFAACLILLAGAACVPRTAPPAPQPAPPPQPVLLPAPPAPPPPAPVAWEDAPLAAGDWSYAGAGPAPQASFGAPGAMLLTLRCAAGGRIGIVRGAETGPVTIVTSFGERILPAAGAEGRDLPASDPLFDQIAFSRGRFLVRSAGGDLVLPSWPEPARLIEDCRT
jgi:hypothetical protein